MKCAAAPHGVRNGTHYLCKHGSRARRKPRVNSVLHEKLHYRNGPRTRARRRTGSGQRQASKTRGQPASLSVEFPPCNRSNQSGYKGGKRPRATARCASKSTTSHDRPPRQTDETYQDARYDKGVVARSGAHATGDGTHGATLRRGHPLRGARRMARLGPWRPDCRQKKKKTETLNFKYLRNTILEQAFANRQSNQRIKSSPYSNNHQLQYLCLKL